LLENYVAGAGNGSFQVDISALPAGNYYLQLIQNSQQTVRPFAVSR